MEEAERIEEGGGHERREGSESDGESTEDKEFSSIKRVKYKQKAVAPASAAASWILSGRDILTNIFRAISQSLSPSNLRNVAIVFKQSIMVLFVEKTTWSLGIFYLMIGLSFSFLGEITGGPKYNSIFLVALMVSIAFNYFPKNSVRPQLVLACLASLTFVLDIQFLVRSPRVVSPACKTFIVFSILAKLLALFDCLVFSNGSARARKYLIRYDDREPTVLDQLSSSYLSVL
jgi:hypothetical protein